MAAGRWVGVQAEEGDVRGGVAPLGGPAGQPAWYGQCVAGNGSVAAQWRNNTW